MQLNYDCVRELLLVLESNLQFDENLEYPETNFENICNCMPEYDVSEILYTTLKLSEANYINVRVINAESVFVDAIYYSITFEGHQYLDSIRNDKLWSDLKKGTKALTFEIVKKLAEKYAIAKFFP